MALAILAALSLTVVAGAPPHIIMRKLLSCIRTSGFRPTPCGHYADLVDDWGWNNLGYRGNPEIVTPNMDALAAAGVKLDRFYTHVRAAFPGP